MWDNRGEQGEEDVVVGGGEEGGEEGVEGGKDGFKTGEEGVEEDGVVKVEGDGSNVRGDSYAQPSRGWGRGVVVRWVW